MKFRVRSHFIVNQQDVMATSQQVSVFLQDNKQQIYKRIKMAVYDTS